MTTSDVLYLAGAIGCLLIGCGFAYAMWQLALTLQSVRLALLPSVSQTLVEAQHTLQEVHLRTLPGIEASLLGVQNNLKRTEELALNVNTSVIEAQAALGKALVSVGDGVQSLGASVQTGAKSLNSSMHTRVDSLNESVSTGIHKLNRSVATPAYIRTRSVFEGLKAGYRMLRTPPRTERLIVTLDSARGETHEGADIIHAN